MTRFNLTLSDGVSFVLKCFRCLKEKFLYQNPSYKIMDLVNNINKRKSKVYWKRSGEKIHEEMITKSDSFNSLEFKIFIIFPDNKNTLLRKHYIKNTRKKIDKTFLIIKNNNVIISIKKLIKRFKTFLYV